MLRLCWLGWVDAWNRSCSTDLSRKVKQLEQYSWKLKSWCQLNTHLRVNISKLGEISIRSIGKELSNRFYIGLNFVFCLGPRVELGIWIEARVKIVDPSDVILRKLLENRTLWQAELAEWVIVLSVSMGSTGCYVCSINLLRLKIKNRKRWSYLLGSVGPGTSANHRSKTTKFCARLLYTGMRSCEM